MKKFLLLGLLIIGSQVQTFCGPRVQPKRVTSQSKITSAVKNSFKTAWYGALTAASAFLSIGLHLRSLELPSKIDELKRVVEYVREIDNCHLPSYDSTMKTIRSMEYSHVSEFIAAGAYAIASFIFAYKTLDSFAKVVTLAD